jgi:small subunit ribosomal protein S16
VAVKIRLMRVGKKKQPTYRVVVADARSPRDGRIIETIGHYGPRQDPSQVEINGDRALAWLRQGAQPTEQVQKLLAVTGVWSTFESERKGKVVTKLSRRGFATGKVAPPVKAEKPAKAAAATAAPAAPAATATATAAPSAPEPVASEPAAPEAAAPEPAAPEPAAPEPAASEPAASEPVAPEAEAVSPDAPEKTSASEEMPAAEETSE